MASGDSNFACHICLDKSEDDDIIETSSESLGGIWSKKGRVDSGVYSRLPARSRLFVDAIIAQRNAVLSRELGLNNSPRNSDEGLAS